MSVVRVLCFCGKVFEIDEFNVGEAVFVECPFCGADVRIPSRAPDEAV